MKAYALAALVLCLGGCKRPADMKAKRLWMGPLQGCIASETRMNCWGVNDAAQLGDGTNESRTEALSSSLGPATSVAFGDRFGCAIFEHKTLSCWGDIAKSTKPTSIDVDPRVGDHLLGLVAGGAHVCVRSEKEVQCIGADTAGQLGDGGKLLSGDTITGMAAGAAHTCLAFGTAVRCRGRGTIPNPLMFPSAVTMLAAGASHTCALLADATVRCWGRNDLGQLGDRTHNDSNAPVVVPGLSGVDSIAAGANFTCARSKSKNVACWGDNRHHQLADGTTLSKSTPSAVQMLMGVEELALGGDSACARLDDGYVKCWGANDRSQLGDGSTVEHDVPMPIRVR